MAGDKAEGMNSRVAAIKQEDCDWGAPASMTLEEGLRRTSGFRDKSPEEQVIVEIKVEDSEEFSVRLGLQNGERGAVCEDGHSSSQPWFAGTGQMGAQQNCWEMKPEICEIDVEITEENGREGDKQPLSRRVRKNFQENGGFSTSSFAPAFLQRNEKTVKSARRLETFTPASFQCRSLPAVVPDQQQEHKYVRVQAGEKPSCCSECGKPLHTRVSILGGEKPHGCSECGKRFSQVSPHQGHTSIHPGAKCGKRFLDGGSLQLLAQSHAGEKPYCGTKGGKPISEVDAAAFCDDEDDDDDNDYFDDEVEDKTWAPGGDDLDTSEDETVAAQQHVAKKSKVSQLRTPLELPRLHAGASHPQNVASRASQTVRAGRRASPVWAFFYVSASDDSVAICNLCTKRIRRGCQGSHLGTTALILHMKRHHSLRWQQYLARRSQSPSSSLVPHAGHSPSSSSSSSPALAVAAAEGDDAAGAHRTDDTSLSSTGARSWKRKHESLSSATVAASRQESLPSSPLWTPAPTMSSPQKLPFGECTDRRKKFGPNHPHARKLNAHLAKLLASQLLPYRLVDSSAFIELMDCAIPQWEVPSRHYFAKKAVPALYAHVESNVSLSMDYAVCRRVHTTTSCAQQRYVSFTAHWVNLLSAGEDAPRGTPLELVVPPLGCRRRSIPPSSSSSSMPKRPGAYGTCSVKRCHAVFQFIRLGEKSHTAQKLRRYFQAQIQQWIAPRQLRVGHVVSDNGPNLVAALRLGSMTHMPCFTHVLGLVVQKFLRAYPGLSDLLALARTICTHFRRSSRATRALANLQRRHALPRHRLTCDQPTHWHSTLHMLERLYEQRRAVSDYLLDNSGRSGVGGCFTLRQWLLMKEVGSVLTPFEQATQFVSRPKAGINDVIPLIYLLEATLTGLVEEEEEENIEEVAEADHHVEQEPLGNSRHLHTGYILKDEEENPVDACRLGSELRPPSVTHRWQQEARGGPVNMPQVPSSSMASWMLRCLQTDPQIVSMKTRHDYWVATLLDPRYKSRMREFLPPSQRDTQMKQYEATLCQQLAETFPKPEEQLPIQPSAHHHPATPTAFGSRASLLERMEHFIQPSRHSETPVHSHRQRLDRMVTDYLSCVGAQENLRSDDPMDFWVARLDQWPELAQYAIEVLSCPPSSVLSERAMGSIVTDQHSKPSTDHVERLTFIQMNQSWINEHFEPPAPDVKQ